MEVLVLEARERIGGRVHTHQGDGLTAGVDLGASIITGTAVDEAKGLQPDPSAVIARCGAFPIACSFSFLLLLWRLIHPRGAALSAKDDVDIPGICCRKRP